MDLTSIPPHSTFSMLPACRSLTAVRSHGSLRNDTPKPLPRFSHAEFATNPPFPDAAAAAMSASALIRDVDDFVKVHGILLAASGVPPPLYRQLFRKLSSETFDGGDFFSIEPCEGGRQRRLLLSADFLGKDSNVFLVDHAWSFRLSDALQQLREVPGLAERMATLMCVDLDLKSNDENLESETQEEESGSLDNVLEILQKEMDKVKERGVDAAIWLELEALGIDDEMLKSLELSTKFPNLVALNLWGNKLEDAETIIQEVTKCRRLKAIWLNDNRALRDWISKLILDGIPGLEIYNSCFTSNFGEWALGFCGSIFGADNPGCLSECSGSLASITTLDLSNRCVRYVMDELGSALRHSDDANFRVAPFLFMPDGKLASAVSFSVLWPIQDVHHGEECTRDFLFGIGEDKQRSARLTAWFHTPENYFIQEFKKYQQQLASRSLPAPKEALITRSILQHDGHSLQVYTDIPHVEEFLTHPKFVLTTNPKDADIIWTSMQVDPEVKKAFELTDLHYTNQFPFEACLVMKHHLAETILKAQGRPEWLQPTYNLETQLSQLIGDYFVRKQDALNNLWILKPWNMARTIDTTVTEDLSAIIRLMETGPKICQKYIEHPALFKGRKFDLRYIVLVRSMDPVQIFLFDVFWVRLANNPYTLEKSSLFEYETHFTVMNYRGRLNHMNTPEFVREFEEEHQVNWQTIHQGIQDMIRSVFDSAAAVHPEMHNPQSRAMYGVDVMLDHLFKPKLLEVTYCPDCRACKYDTEAIVGNGGIFRGRDFFNTVFECLFLGKTAHNEISM
ncbi:tubulin--tyrosine ligase-like protein [Musa troglodytarum]|uniref:Tubulin--tyrosine ligase-like protein n=1 Tax=Musa troglodytarum TaxID=320322 RepID=A0A9E7IHV9_9LILI|nr:tubulin--tyrosine ligase-like protein [Musa troglodytarum]